MGRGSLTAGFLWLSVANLALGVSQWVILILLAQVTSVDAVGLFTRGLAVSGPVFLLTDLHLRGIVVTDQERSFRRADYVGLRLWTTALGTLVVLALAFAIQDTWQGRLTVAALGLGRACESISDILHAILQQGERFRPLSAAILIRSLASLALVPAVAAGLDEVAFGALIWLLVRVVVLLAYDLPVARRYQSETLPEKRTARWHVPSMARLVRLTLPLGLVFMLVAVNAYLPVYFVDAHFDEHALGIFAGLAALIGAGTALCNALGQVALPRLALHLVENMPRAFIRLLVRAAALAGSMGLAGVVLAALAGKGFLTVLLGQEYAEHTDPLLLLAIGAVPGWFASILGYGLTAARAFRALLFAYVVLLGVNFTACAVLIPAYGIQGAAGSVLAVHTTTLCLFVPLVWLTLRRP